MPGPDGGAHLGRLLSAAPRIQYIDASSNFFGSEGADYMSLQIDTNTALTDLVAISKKALFIVMLKQNQIRFTRSSTSENSYSKFFIAAFV
jgi:hypothetical protein